MKQYPVRYGHLWKLVMAIVLPPLLSIYPFIWLMPVFVPDNDWVQYFVILGFLGLISLFTVWLTLRVYPKALLTVDENEIGLCFGGTGWLQPNDFNVTITDITYMSPYNIIGNDYILFKTQKPSRSFRLSARSYDEDVIAEFNEAMELVRALVDAAKVNE